MSKLIDDTEFSWNAHDGYKTDLVDQLIDHARALEAMLKKHEYSDEGYCPECGMSEFHGHDLDCQLAKLLEGCDDQLPLAHGQAG